jgi:hypothetical protein
LGLFGGDAQDLEGFGGGEADWTSALLGA